MNSKLALFVVVAAALSLVAASSVGAAHARPAL